MFHKHHDIKPLLTLIEPLELQLCINWIMWSIIMLFLIIQKSYLNDTSNKHLPLKQTDNQLMNSLLK